MQATHTWRQSGRISLWRYTENERNYPGWHFNADAAGCHSLVALLDALSRDGEGTRTVSISAPTNDQLRVPNNKSGLAAWQAPDKLKVILSARPDDWSFPPAIEPAVVTLGTSWLAPLSEGIQGIAKGRGDHAIGSKDHHLWFWWCLG
ncbi:hypothetical protein [Pseudoxanthomonas beigongshangi]